MTGCACVIPAAGYSSRMGRFKPLLPYKGEPLIGRVVQKALRVCPVVHVVTGHHAAELSRFLHDFERVRVHYNAEYARGMIGSIATGARHVEGEWYFVVPGDMPEIPIHVFASLARTTGEADGRGNRLDAEIIDAVFPVVGGRRGHPVLISSRTTGDLLREFRSCDSMRSFLENRRVREVAFPGTMDNRGIFYDIDRPGDLSVQVNAP